MDSGISKLDLKRENRRQILRVINEKAPISRVDIAAELHLTRAAVSILVNEMLGEGILTELGEAEPVQGAKKGRRKILLDLNETARFAVGIYLDTKGVCIGLTTLRFHTLDKTWFPCNAALRSTELVTLIRHAFSAMLLNSCLCKEQLVGVGVGVMPSMFERVGCQSQREGVYAFPQLQADLSAALGVPVYVDHAQKLFAEIGVYADDCKAAPYEQLLFCQNELRHYCAVYAEKDRRMVRDLHTYCLTRGGEELPGYPDGSVQAELSDDLLHDEMLLVFSPLRTPALWKLLDGKPQCFTLAALLTASCEDTLLQPLAETAMERLVHLLYQIDFWMRPKRICLFQLGLEQEHLERLREIASRMIGMDFAQKLVISMLPERYYFLSGCAYTIRDGFFRPAVLYK